MKKCFAIILMLSLAAATYAQTKKKTTKTSAPPKTTKTTTTSTTAKTASATAGKVDSVAKMGSVTDTATAAKTVASNNKTGSAAPVSASSNTNIGSDLSKGIGALTGMLGSGEQAGSVSSLTNTDIVNGLKEALEKGAVRSGDKLSMVDGFFANAALKILMPPEALKAEKSLRDMGMGSIVDDAILAMNRAAEDAAKSASPIFINAIKSMSINDALGILKGADTAATGYLRSKTVSPLTEAFRPVIESSLAKVDATKYWKSIFTTYNMVAFKKINPDLTAYVTERALSGIFIQLGQEEAEIRKNPLARTSTLLQKVFGSK